MDLRNNFEFPFYLKFTIQLLMVVLIGLILSFGSVLFVPLGFAILLSILLLPIAGFFQTTLHFSRAMAALTCIIFATGIFAALIYFLSAQVSSFARDFPSIKEHLNQHYITLTRWIQQKFHLNRWDQQKLIESATGDVKTKSVGMIGSTVVTLTSVIFYTIMVAIYSFLMLYYRNVIRKFLFSVFKPSQGEDVEAVLGESRTIIQRFVAGLFIEMSVVAIANMIFLSSLGVKYAIFLGVFVAILNVIPYVGILTGIIFTCLVTLTTSSNLGVLLWIIIGLELIHFIDANFLMPRIVGSRVKINALITFIGVVTGGLILGLPGIFLALPFLAILKVIFDRVADLRPWGLLMGGNDEVKSSGFPAKFGWKLLKRKRLNIPENDN